MALGDLYELRWRTEQAAVVMNNSVKYEQVESNVGTFANSALALLSCIQEGTANVLAYWRQVGTDTASITCAIAEKIFDTSQTGPEQAILFDTGFTTDLINALAPSQCLTLQLLTNADSGDEYNRRNLYLGGLDDTILTGMGLSEAADADLRDNAAWLLRPEIGQPGLFPFQAQMPVKESVGLFPWRTITRVNPPHYLTRKNSRRLTLCV